MNVWMGKYADVQMIPTHNMQIQLCDVITCFDFSFAHLHICTPAHPSLFNPGPLFGTAKKRNTYVASNF